MDYATLGPSELQPPFSDGYNWCFLNTSFSQSRAGQVSNPILHFKNLAEFCVFIKQSLLSICASCFPFIKNNYSFFLSYRAFLQSSLNILDFIRFRILFQITCVGFWYGLGIFFLYKVKTLFCFNLFAKR